MTEITITTNHWHVPSVETAFSGWLEGIPTEKEKQETIAKTIAARATWKPSDAGMKLVEQLKSFIGWQVQVQFWDSIMFVLEDEGPNPIHAVCEGITLLQDGEHLQAYIEISNEVEIQTVDGYSPFGYLQKHSDSKFQLVSLANIWTVKKLQRMDGENIK